MTTSHRSPLATRTRTRRTCGALLVTAVAVTGLGVSGVLTPDAAEADAPHGRSAVVQQRLDALVADDGFPGALAAVRGPDGRHRDVTAGVGDLRTGEPVPVDGQVRIGSNTKTFTAAVVLQLVGEGLVDLDAPVERYLPGLVRGPGGDGTTITVRQLLQHTSGLPEFVPVLYQDPLAVAGDRFVEPHQSLDMALALPASSAPGTAWEYSNTNYVVAGLLVQQVTGRPIGEEITRRVIEPLGLEHTYWPAEGEQALRGEHPRGYHALTPDGELVDHTELETSPAWAAGALVSTPDDLLRFFTALLDGDLLSPELLAEMQTTVPAPDATASGDEAYGLGLQTATLSCGVTAWTHGGDIEGFETRLAVTEDGRGAVVAVTALPRSLEQAVHVEEAVDAAVCG